MARAIEILNPAVETPDSPSDCQLLVGLPLEREDFLKRLREGPKGNFANCFRNDGRSRLIDDAVYLIYEKYAKLGHNVIEEVAAFGVGVVCNARLSDLALSVARFRVTTLFAHSRDARFQESDIVDRELTLDALANPGSQICKLIRDFRPGGHAPPGSSADRKKIIAYLNEALDGPALEADDRLGQTTRRHLRWLERRSLFEAALPEGFQGGEAIEFFDGFVSLASVLDAMPSPYAGKIDLTSCHSTVLAEGLRRKCKSCLLMVNEQATSLDLRFAIYRQVIRRLRRKPQPYEDALFFVRKELL